MDVLVIGDDGGGSPGFVGDRLVQLGGRLQEVDRDTLTSQVPDPSCVDLVLLLGSPRSAHDPRQQDVVRAEEDLLLAALRSGTPAIGICYGVQLAAVALGGSVRPHTIVEAGFYPVTPDEPALCPPGPWVQMHEDTFDPPPGSAVIGRTAAAVQGFRRAGAAGAGAFVGWQFHPEATEDSVSRWTHRPGGEDFVRRAGTDPEAFRRRMGRESPRLRRAAADLTDSALAWLKVH